jgi:hypothetical protein
MSESGRETGYPGAKEQGESQWAHGALPIYSRAGWGWSQPRRQRYWWLLAKTRITRANDGKRKAASQARMGRGVSTNRASTELA